MLKFPQLDCLVYLSTSATSCTAIITPIGNNLAAGEIAPHLHGNSANVNPVILTVFDFVGAQSYVDIPTLEGRPLSRDSVALRRPHRRSGALAGGILFAFLSVHPV